MNFSLKISRKFNERFYKHLIPFLKRCELDFSVKEVISIMEAASRPFVLGSDIQEKILEFGISNINKIKKLEGKLSLDEIKKTISQYNSKLNKYSPNKQHLSYFSFFKK